MIRQIKTRRFLAAWLAAAYCVAFFTGCAAIQQKEAAKKTEPPDVYYDFGDVLVPQQLIISKEESFVYQTTGFTAGVLVLHGRMDSSALIKFFKENMQKDNWTMEGLIKTPHNLMLLKKENRWCVIYICQGQLKTDVKIWVMPTGLGSQASGPADMGLLK